MDGDIYDSHHLLGRSVIMKENIGHYRCIHQVPSTLIAVLIVIDRR